MRLMKENTILIGIIPHPFKTPQLRLGMRVWGTFWSPRTALAGQRCVDWTGQELELPSTDAVFLFASFCVLCDTHSEGELANERASALSRCHH